MAHPYSEVNHDPQPSRADLIMIEKSKQLDELRAKVKMLSSMVWDLQINIDNLLWIDGRSSNQGGSDGN